MDKSEDFETNQLDEAIVQMHALECAVRREQLRVIAKMSSFSDYEKDGASSMAAWLSARLSWSQQYAREVVTVAVALESLPQIAEAFAQGLISWEMLVPLISFATPETDEELSREVLGWNVAMCKSAARQYKVVKERSELAHQKRGLRYRWVQDDSVLVLSGRFGVDQGSVIANALSRIADRQNSPDSENGLYPPLEQLQADALVEVCSLSLGADADADRATVVVHVEEKNLRAKVEGLGATEEGQSLCSDTIRRLGCDSRLQLVTEKYGQAIGISRISRTVPHWLSRQIRIRDKGCRFPGCENNRWTHAHHIRHWADGGPTDLDNLITLCGRHHRYLHEGDWHIEGNPTHQIKFKRSDGKTLFAQRPHLKKEALTRISA